MQETNSTITKLDFVFKVDNSYVKTSLKDKNGNYFQNNSINNFFNENTHNISLINFSPFNLISELQQTPI